MINGTVSRSTRRPDSAIIVAAGTEYPFHCVEIADGTRTIETGAAVDFDVLRKLGPRRGRPDLPRPTHVHAQTWPTRSSPSSPHSRPGRWPATAMSPTTPAGRSGESRRRALASTDVELPWWRVVRADGRIVTGEPERQAALLRAEGVVVRHGRVVARSHRPLRADRCCRPRAVADLTLTNAIRMLARASRNVGVSGPSRSPSPSTRLPTASMASDGRGQVRRRRRQVDRRQLVQPHHVVGDDHLGGHVGEAPACVLDRLLGVAEDCVCVVASFGRRARRASSCVDSSAT